MQQVPPEAKGAAEGEARTVAAFQENPYGCTGGCNWLAGAGEVGFKWWRAWEGFGLKWLAGEGGTRMRFVGRLERKAGGSGWRVRERGAWR